LINMLPAVNKLTPSTLVHLECAASTKVEEWGYNL
jgi:hypothetical protein